MPSCKIPTIHWGRSPLSPEESGFLCGDFHFRIRSEGDEVFVACHENTKDESVWSRWAVPGSPDAVDIVPLLPKLPVLVEPETPFHLVPNAHARLFIRVPISLGIEFGTARLCEYMSVVLSKTWFGEVEDGELCLFQASSARRKFEKDLIAPHMVCCPVSIRNVSSETLRVERICLRVPNLRVYRCGEGHLWASETTVSYRGGNERSVLEFETKAPPEAKAAVSMGPPRQSGDTSLIGRTFRSLRELTLLFTDD